MKLLFIAPDLSIGGLQSSLVRLCNGLTDQFHHEVHLVLIGSDCTLKNRLRPEIRVKTLNRRFRSLRAFWQLKRLVANLDPDIIIGWSLYPGIWAVALKVLGGRSRIVVSERSYPPVAYGFDKGASATRLLFRISMAWSDLATANSQEAVAYIQQTVPRARCVRLYNPVPLINDMPSYPGFEHCWHADVHRMIAIGRLINREKGFDTLLQACAKLREKALNFHLLIVGDGPDRRELENLAAELGLNDCVTFFGFSERPEQLLRGAEVFILSSNFEGFPNALIEAMMAGKIVVSTTYGAGPAEVITDGVSGFLSPPRNPTALAGAILQACSLTDLRRAEMGDLARERVRQFEPSQATSHFNSVLLDVIASPPKGLLSAAPDLSGGGVTGR